MYAVVFETSISIACGDYVIEKGIIDSVSWEKHEAEQLPEEYLLRQRVTFKGCCDWRREILVPYWRDFSSCALFYMQEGIKHSWNSEWNDFTLFYFFTFFDRGVDARVEGVSRYRCPYCCFWQVGTLYSSLVTVISSEQRFDLRRLDER